MCVCECFGNVLKCFKTDVWAVGRVVKDNAGIWQTSQPPLTCWLFWFVILWNTKVHIIITIASLLGAKTIVTLPLTYPLFLKYSWWWDMLGDGLVFTSIISIMIIKIVWDPFLQKDIEKFEKIHKRAAGFIKQDYSSKDTGSMTRMLKDLGLPTWNPEGKKTSTTPSCRWNRSI